MKKILFVDDDPNVLAAFQRQLRKQFSIEVASSGEQGLAILQRWREFGVIVADMRMPGLSGVDFLSKVKELAPDVVRMMLTGNADQQTAAEAVNQGNIFRFLTKPCTTEKLIEALTAGLRQHELIVTEHELLANTLYGSVKVLTEILAIADSKSFAQAESLRNSVRTLAQKLQIREIWPLEVAAMLAHIGAVTIPPEVIMKAREGHPLADNEQQIFKRLPEVGANLLSHIPRLEEVCRIIQYQDKNFDGTGFPEDHVSGNSIPLGARMLRILQDLAKAEATGKNRGQALEELQARQGFYDPQILEVVAAPDSTSAAVSAATRAPVLVRFEQLRIGDVLRSDIETRDGLLIVVSGNRITPALIERLRNFAELSGIKEPIQVDPYAF